MKDRASKAIADRKTCWPISELADHLDLPRPAILRQIRCGNLRAVAFGPRAFRVAPGAVVRWLAGAGESNNKPVDPTMEAREDLPLPDRFLRVSELAELLSLGKDKIYRAVASGEVTAFRFGKKCIRVSPSSVRQWLASRTLRVSDRPPRRPTPPQG